MTKQKRVKIVDNEYKKTYREVFEDILERNHPEGFYDETAIPSYIHKNKFLSWLFWKRIEVALMMAGPMHDKLVLDFGCGGGGIFKYLDRHRCRIVGCDNTMDTLAQNICRRFGILAEIYKDLSEIKDRKFDYIFALDVLEHVDSLCQYINRFIELSHENTEIVISGPTENFLYKTGRLLIGYSGHYHVRNIYEIEEEFRKKGLKCRALKNLYSPFIFFRISTWGRH